MYIMFIQPLGCNTKQIDCFIESKKSQLLIVYHVCILR
jgi:hypothetical protein